MRSCFSRTCNDYSARKYRTGASPGGKRQTAAAAVDEIVYSLWRHRVSRFDGDLIFTTDNNVLVNCVRPQPALMCAQRNAPKKVPTEEDIIESNIAAFGDEIGKITNRITSMYDVQAGFAPDSEEYKILDYRIKCGQLC